MAEGDEPANGTNTAAADMVGADMVGDDADWPVLSELDLHVCLTDSAIRGTVAGQIPFPERGGVIAS